MNPGTAATVKFCGSNELLMTPSPLMVSILEPVLIVNELPPASKTMLFTLTLFESVTVGALLWLKVATSPGPLGTVVGVQLASVLQSLLVGSRFQVALPA